MKPLLAILLAIISFSALGEESNTSYLATADVGILYGTTTRGFSIGHSWKEHYATAGLHMGTSPHHIVDGHTAIGGGHFRQFVGPSLNLRADLAYRRFQDQDYWFRDSDLRRTQQYLHTYEDLVMGFALGNHWAFDSGLFLGADWIGLSSQVAELSSSTSYEIGDETPRTVKEIEDIERQRRRPQITALNFSIGFLF